jgi:hypothetical protein
LSSGSRASPINMATLHPAHPLPAKIEHWDALHLTFRHFGLPHLPTIHNVAIRNVLSSAAYDRPIAPSRYSIKTLAWMGDGVLYLAATKACLKAGLSQPYQGCEDLGVSSPYLCLQFCIL